LIGAMGTDLLVAALPHCCSLRRGISHLKSVGDPCKLVYKGVL